MQERIIWEKLKLAIVNYSTVMTPAPLSLRFSLICLKYYRNIRVWPFWFVR